MPQWDSLAQRGLSDEHMRALAWFEEHEGSDGARPWRQEGRSVASGVSVPLTAQRGIHVPARWTYALSVAAQRASQYNDGEPLSEPDGGWSYLYKAHRGADGVGVESRWNRGLIACWRDEVPFGVMRQLPNGQYRIMGLAIVDTFFPEADTFLLRGPATLGANAEPGIALAGAADDADEMQADRWTDLVAMEPPSAGDDHHSQRRLAAIRERQQDFRSVLLAAYGRVCAVSGYDAEAALQAAHISGYAGVSSHSPANGLLLRADLHVLFDRHLIAVESVENLPRVLVGPRLRGTKYEEFDRVVMRVPGDTGLRPSSARLEQHRLVFDEVSARTAS